MIATVAGIGSGSRSPAAGSDSIATGTSNRTATVLLPGAAGRVLPLAAVFAATVFLSASLLFFVQPVVEKMVLPHLGGAPAVWTTAMLFFQTALLVGYGYVHLTPTRLAIGLQAAVHAALVAAGPAFLPLAVPAGWSYEPGARALPRPARARGDSGAPHQQPLL